MLFSLVFAGAVLDALLNGPKLQGWRLYLAVATALVAVALQHVAGFVTTELLLVGLFAESAALERKAQRAAEEARKEAAAGKAVDDRSLPGPARKLLEQALETFRKNLNGGDKNAYGAEWKVVASDGGVQVSLSDFPGHKCKFFKVEAQVNADYDTLYRELVLYDYRTKWDTSLAKGRVLKDFDDIPGFGEPTLDAIYTQPAAGGIVAPREIIDLGVMCFVDGGFEFANTSLPSGITFKEAPKKATGERAFTHIGSGMCIKPVPGSPGAFKYTLISALDLGGWLPAGVVNNATSGALLDSTKALIAHLKAKKD